MNIGRLQTKYGKKDSKSGHKKIGNRKKKNKHGDDILNSCAYKKVAAASIWSSIT